MLDRVDRLDKLFIFSNKIPFSGTASSYTSTIGGSSESHPVGIQGHAIWTLEYSADLVIFAFSISSGEERPHIMAAAFNP